MIDITHALCNQLFVPLHKDKFSSLDCYIFLAMSSFQAPTMIVYVDLDIMHF